MDNRSFSYPDYDTFYDLQEPGPIPSCPPPSPPPQPERKVIAVGEGPHPVKRPTQLFPIPPQLPPKHTQIQPRCLTCTHFEMCSFKKDYLKTLTLIQNDLGSPQADYELSNRYITIPGFIGLPIINQDDYFPKEVIFNNSDNKGKLWLAKFNGINYINVVYKDRKYYILLKLEYDKENEIYKLKSCQEAFYKVDYELNDDSLVDIQLGLIEWREKIIDAQLPPPPPIPDIINTTHFSANLNCDMYNWNKKSFEDAVKDFLTKYPNGIPLEDGGRTLYHIATYHIAGGEVPYAPLFFPQEEKKKPKLPKKRRDDC